MAPTLCAYCGSPLLNKWNKKFCSALCRSKASGEKVVNQWKENPDTATIKEGLKTSVKEYLIKEAGNKCSECEWSEINPSTGRVPLTIDHIDGDCHNNSTENLRVLCPNCHALKSTYKALNKGSKRYSNE